MLALPDLTSLHSTFPTSSPWECLLNMPCWPNIRFLISNCCRECCVLLSAQHYILLFNLVLILSQTSPGQSYNARLHLRSFKKQSGNLILCCVGWEDTFIYHNNKDNSIKTPIIARYNRGNIYLS